MSDTYIDIHKHLEVLDKWREDRENLQAEQDLKMTAGERLLIAASELEKNKGNPDIINETILIMTMLGQTFVFNDNDIKIQI